MRHEQGLRRAGLARDVVGEGNGALQRHEVGRVHQADGYFFYGNIEFIVVRDDRLVGHQLGQIAPAETHAHVAVEVQLGEVGGRIIELGPVDVHRHFEVVVVFKYGLLYRDYGAQLGLVVVERHRAPVDAVVEEALLQTVIIEGNGVGKLFGVAQQRDEDETLNLAFHHGVVHDLQVPVFEVVGKAIKHGLRPGAAGIVALLFEL